MRNKGAQRHVDPRCDPSCAVLCRKQTGALMLGGGRHPSACKQHGITQRRHLGAPRIRPILQVMGYRSLQLCAASARFVNLLQQLAKRERMRTATGSHLLPHASQIRPITRTWLAALLGA